MIAVTRHENHTPGLPRRRGHGAVRAHVVLGRSAGSTEEQMANVLAEQIIDIVFVVGMNQIISRFHAAILTEVDEDTLEQVAATCPVPFPQVPYGEGSTR